MMIQVAIFWTTNDEKISQHLAEINESFENEQDLLHLAFKELEVRLNIWLFEIFVKIAISYFQLFLTV